MSPAPATRGGGPQWRRLTASAVPSSTERTLAYGRALLASWAAVTVYVDPTEPSRFAAFAYTLLVAYALASVALLAALRRTVQPPAALGIVLHACDVSFAAVISLLTDGPNSPFFAFFTYVLLSAALRWGLRATLATAAAGVMLLLGEGALLAATVPGEHTVQLNRILMRVAHLSVMGLLVGKMGEGQRRATVESTAAARIVGGVRSVGGDHATLAAAAELVAVFEARAAVVAVRNRDGGPVRVWATDTGAGTASTLPAREDELQYLAPLPAEAVLFDRRRAVLRVVAVDRDARAVPATGEAVPLLGGRSWAVAMAADFTLGDEWSGRAYVLDPGPGFRGVDALRFLARLVKEVAPAVESVYLLSRLRSRAGAVERARVARELHDGVLQALIGLEMQVDVLRRRASMGEEEAAHPLTHIQAHLRHEIITVRELMEEIRPVEVSRRDLVEHIAGMVDRFRHETGLAASFVCAVEEVDLPGRVCRELVRVVQEALVNVRRHSGASSVMVRLEPRDDDWTLVIDDNGKGLSFAGRLDDRELAAQRLGPVVIRERVIALGGRLAVDSGPGRGTRLEVFVPQAARA